MKVATIITHLARAACAVLAIAALCATARAQQGPQDNWTYYGVQFSSPTPANNLSSIAIGGGGVYVGEWNAGNPTKVIRFTEAGTFVSRFSATFTYIIGLACDSAGNVYVFDAAGPAIAVKVFDQSGTFLRQWGGPGTGDGQFRITFSSPTMIAIDRNDQVYVAESGNNRVEVFDTNGALLRKWGQLGSLPGQFPADYPSIVATSSDGRVYAGKDGFGTKVFNTSGGYIESRSWGVFAASSDGLIFIDRDNPNDPQSYKVGDASQFLSTFLQPLSGVRPTSKDAAFSKRGDLFCVSATKVSVFKREYGSSKNFPSNPGIPQPMVLSSNQRAGTSLLDIDYQVTDADSPTVTTGLLAFKKIAYTNFYGYGGAAGYGSMFGDAVVMSTFVEGTSGNIGLNQPSNSTLHVTWNMPADWAVDYASIQVEALARDSRNLLGIHWITVPASGGNSAFQVSSNPVSEGDLLDLWFWFLATHQNVSLSSVFDSGRNKNVGTITGTNGVYTGMRLAGDVFGNLQTYWPVSTPAGRLFAFEKMGVRGITGDELARAQAGNYGFGGLDAQTTIVKEAVAATSYLKGWGTSTFGLTNWLSFAGSNPVQVATSGEHELILRADGTLWSLGFNGYGQLGNGTTTDRMGPGLVATGVAQIAVGGNYDAISGARMGQSFFVKTDGTLWAMGANGRGQLGDGTTTNRSTPVQIGTNVSRVAAGTAHTVFLKTNGTLWAVGANYYGQLGDGTNTDRATPVQIATGAAQVAAGDNHTLFVKTDGTLWTVGYNQFGQLGVGVGGNRNTPSQVATGVAVAVGGSNHSMFVKTNGTLWAMGYNYYGQLGDGTATQRNSPVQVATGVSTAAVGTMHSLFIKTDGTLWAMGWNYYGQLGDGTTTDRGTPVQVDSGVTAIAAGYFNSLEVVVTAP